MMKKRWTCMATVLAVASLLIASAGAAHAAGIVCPVAISGKVTPSTACEIGSTNNDFVTPPPPNYQVNKDAMFGFSDWLFAEKGLEDEERIDIGLTTTGDGFSGTWSIDDIWTSLGITHLMIVLKGGAAHEPPHYVGYLILTGATSGTYATPFINDRTGGPTAISHISVYFRGGDVPDVPEPATLALLGIGLAATARRYRRSRQRA